MTAFEQLRADLERIGAVARVLVEAALKNRDVQAYIRDLNPWHGCPDLWTVAGVKRNPPVRVEFEGGYVFGGVGEAIASGASKQSFGKVIGVFPLDERDPVGEVQILYVWKDDNPRQKRFVQRKELKQRLGRHWRKLVEEAMCRPKGKFLAEIANKDVEFILRRRLGVDPGRFWRVVKGKEFLDLPKPSVQPSLFGDDDGVESSGGAP